jgi:hypothetical protein
VLPIAPGVVGAYERNVDTNPAYATPAARWSRSPAPRCGAVPAEALSPGAQEHLLENEPSED